MLGPTLSEGLDDFWHASVDAVDCAISGTLVQGDLLYWYAKDGVTVAGTGRMYYVYSDGSNVYITLDKVSGISPRRATSMITSNGTTIEYTGDGDLFRHKTQLGLTWEEYLQDKFCGALSNSQKEQSSVWDAFKPDPLGVGGISGVFQLDDSIYAVRDFWGGRFVDGVEEPSVGDLVEVDNVAEVGTFTARVGQVQLDSGSWEEGTAAGTLFLYPDSATELDMSRVDNWGASTSIENLDTGNTVGTTLADGERQYNNKGLLWKLDKDARQGGWRYVDTGYSVQFSNGTTAPLAEVAPLIVDPSTSGSSVTDTGYQNFQSPATEYPSTGTYSAWTNLQNLTSITPAAYANTTIASTDYSRVIELVVTPGSGLVGNAKIIGVEVQVTAAQTGGVDSYFSKVQLRNNRTGAVYLSQNKATNEAIAASDTVYTFGGQLDLWGLENIDQEALDDEELELLLQFYNPAGTSRDIDVDLVQIKIHYAVSGQRVYFWDGTNDVDSGDLYTYQVFDGAWVDTDAKGWMTVHGLAAPSLIRAGNELRNAPAGGGDLIALNEGVSKNLLPGLAELRNRSAIYQSRVATFSGDEDSQAAYVATGASPAFMVDTNDVFSFIRTPVDRDKDKPRYVEFHRNHLILGIGSHFLVSSIGTPNNFNTADGATQWNPKDRVTGLAAAPAGTTMVACEDSIHAFTGSGASGSDAFALKIVTDNSGARPYTLINLLGNTFVDYAGITTAAAADTYGGFDVGRKSQHVNKLLQRLLGANSIDSSVGNKIIGGIPVRKKNQYRIYLSNGDILTATFPDDPSLPLAFTQQNYTAYSEGDSRGYESIFVPTSIDSSVLSTGEESIVMGTELGHVMKIDPGYMDILSYANKAVSDNERRSAMDSWKFFKFIDITPFHSQDPSQMVAYKHIDVYLEHGGCVELNRLAKPDYVRISEVPSSTNIDDTLGTKVVVGSSTNFSGRLETDYFSWYVDDATDGLSTRLSKFGGEGAVPLRIPSLVLYSEPKGRGRNRIHKNRAYTVTTATIPQDFYIEGVTGVIEITSSAGSVLYDLALVGSTGTVTVTGGSGSVITTAGLWTWDTEDFTFDDETPTFDGDTS
jgi:hypothetical protein